MAHISADRIRDTSTTTGSGNFTVSGTAQAGYRTFSAVLSVSDTFYYAIQHQTANEWETGLGTYSSANVFARTTVYASSNSGSAVVFSSGTKDTFITLAASRTVQLDNSGNVGIGTASPSTKMEVIGTITSNKNSASQYLALSMKNSTQNYGVYIDQDNVSSNSWSLYDSTNSQAATRYYPSSSGYWQFYTNGSERMRIDSSGNVGISTSSPAEKLTIQKGNGGIRLDGAGTASSNVWIDYYVPNNGGVSTSSNFAGRIYAASSGTSDYSDNSVRIAVPVGGSATPVDTLIVKGGNVGIGTASPGVKLDVVGPIRSQGTAATSFNNFQSTGTTTATNYGTIANTGNTLIWGVDSSAGGAVTGSSAYSTWIGSNAAYPFHLLTSGVVRATIDLSGNVGIGTASPSRKLSIAAVPYATSQLNGISITPTSATAFASEFLLGIDGSGLPYTSIATGSDGNSFMTFSTAAAERMRINSSGNVGIGTSSPVGRLGVVNTGGNSQISIGDTAVSSYSTLRMYGGSGHYNFQLGVQNNVSNAFEITPSTAAGGTTFSTPAMVVDSSGNVGIGDSGPSVKLSVLGASGTNGAARANIWATDTTAFAAGVGGGITFRAKYNSAGAYFDAANVKGIKEDGTDGSFAGALVLSTGQGGGSPTERMRIGSSGQIGIGGANYGTSGQVLTSGGSGAAPSWATPSGGVTSLTAGNGITVSASTGAVTVSQDIYTGSAQNNTSFPIGTVVGFDTGVQTAMAASVVIRLFSSGTNYTLNTYGSLSALTGTWRVRYGTSGSCGGNGLLAQRVA